MLGLSLVQSVRCSLIFTPCFETCFPLLEKKEDWMRAALQVFGDKRKGYRSDMDAVAALCIGELRVKCKQFYRGKSKKIVEDYSKAEISALQGRLMKACLLAFVKKGLGESCTLREMQDMARA